MQQRLARVSSVTSGVRLVGLRFFPSQNCASNNEFSSSVLVYMHGDWAELRREQPYLHQSCNSRRTYKLFIPFFPSFFLFLSWKKKSVTMFPPTKQKKFPMREKANEGEYGCSDRPTDIKRKISTDLPSDLHARYFLLLPTFYEPWEESRCEKNLFSSSFVSFSRDGLCQDPDVFGRSVVDKRLYLEEALACLIRKKLSHRTS